MKPYGDFYNPQQNFLNNSGFSSSAEKYIIINSGILQKNELEKEKKLKEQEKIFSEMLKKKKRMKKKYLLLILKQIKQFLQLILLIIQIFKCHLIHK